LIVAAGGREIREPDDVYDALGEVHAGSRLQLSVVRGAEDLTLEASFESTASASDSDAGPVH
jgi:hypothetical protein